MGQLGFILSNAFATRDFGKPLVQQVFNRVELRNVVDCSGLMFPGHGTPTCVLLGHSLAIADQPKEPTLLCGTRPGMGQLREEPEETALWREIEEGWETGDFVGRHVVTARWPASQTRAHPWSFDAGGAGVKQAIEMARSQLDEVAALSVSYSTVSGMDPVFLHSPDSIRRLKSAEITTTFATGEHLRNWSVITDMCSLLPYDEHGAVIAPERLHPNVLTYFQRVRKSLAEREGMQFRAGVARGDPWYRYEYYDHARASHVGRCNWAFIATHVSAAALYGPLTTNRHINNLVTDPHAASSSLALALLNSSAALFWLKQVCFCKRYSENAETDDYYEFAGGKVEQLPVPDVLLKDSVIRRRASAFAERCAALGAEVPGFHPRKLFERPGEAYTDWYRGIRGYQLPHPNLKRDWTSADQLQVAWRDALDAMSVRRREMVALQEEQDWLVYAAYGLLPEDDPAVNVAGPDDLLPIDELDRPYRLTQHERDIPPGWPAAQRALWQDRVVTIETNARVAQIEQPAYKRRWEEPFGDGDFVDAYEWWLREKAEYLLEYEYAGGPVNLEMWASRLREDPGTLAAYEAALAIDRRQPKPRYSGRRSFAEHLRRIIEEETVPDDRRAFKGKHTKLRGIDEGRHLPNGVPRERFRAQTARSGWYAWAGKDLWAGVKGDVWDV